MGELCAGAKKKRISVTEEQAHRTSRTIADSLIGTGDQPPTAAFQ
jgi:hypothetical protein